MRMARKLENGKSFMIMDNFQLLGNLKMAKTLVNGKNTTKMEN